MKRVLFSLLLMAFGVAAMAQQSIQLRSTDKAICVKSDMRSLKASFSFSTIEAQDYNNERGNFSWITMANTVLGGNEGDPQIPVVNELIAVPFGAHPRIEITSYSTTDYRLDDYDMKTLVPRQPSLRKDKRPEEVPFVMNQDAYQTRGLRSAPQAIVSVEGTMRGVQLGKMTIEPVSYDPVNNTIRVFNDIEVTVHFDGADRQATEQMLIDTYSPYFDIVYKSLFNGRAIASVYDDHQDLYSTPVKMLVVTTSTYANSTAFQSWLTWKKQKGIDVDIYTVTSNTSSSTIRSGIQSRYNTNHPSFLVIVGDETVVPYYSLWDYDSYYGDAATDLEYASVDSDIYHDIFISRMPVNSTTQLGYLVDKILMYEKYTMSDPNYLNETLLIAGWDEPDPGYTSWTPIAGKPTINYATNNYFNTAHGITAHAFITTATGQRTCYNYINQVGFVNYTAHGNIQEWSDPSFTNSNVNSLTNANKPFWAMGNCCLSASYSNTRYTPCFGETMVRAQNKAAFGYIGSVVETYWFEDLSFGVGAFNASYSTNNNPTLSNTQKGAYDALFDDTGFNTLNAVPYIGNIAVSYIYANNYTTSGSPCSPEYYWRCYQCFGDGSVMPYLKVPDANNVSHNNTIPAGSSTFRVNADARSYVSVTVNDEIIGVAAVPANATYVDVPFTTAPVAGQTAMIVVTRNQRQPYIGSADIVSNAQYEISASVSPNNAGSITGAGSYYETAQCTLTATPNHGYAFDNWKQGNTVVSTEPSYTFTVTGAVNYTANFHALTLHHITYTPQQTNGTISVSPTEAYAGDVITLTATPAAGYCLDQWSVSTVGKGNVPVVNNQFTMPDSDMTISATFKSGYTVTVASVANGTITATPTTAMPGDIITLTATPNTGCEFMTWNAYKTGDPSTAVTVLNNTLRMPSYDVTVSAVFATSTIAGPITIGSGTSTDRYLPTYTYYKYSLTQQIYTAAELGEAGSITAIAFQVGNSKASTRNLSIYMRPTDLTAFTSTTGWETMGDVYLVYSGSVSFNASGWTTIQLDTPFKYDGVKNVNICVVDNSGSDDTNGNYPYFRVYSTGANRAMRVYNDNNAYSVGTEDQISTYTGTYVTSNNQIQITKKLVNAETITVTPTMIEGLSYVQGEGPSETKVVDVTGVDLSNDITVTAPTGFEISTTANGIYGTSLTIPRVTDDRGERGTTNWDFEGSMENWTNVDADGDTYGWVLGSAVGGIYLAEGSNMSEGHSGSDMMVSGSYSNVNGVLTPDNWLISPQVELGGTFSMWAKGQDASWFAEHFGIYVSTTNNSISSFQALNEWTLSSGEWKQYSVDLSFFAGQTGYIAIRHFNCTNMFMIDVDDFELNTEATFTPDLPVVITPATVYVRLQDGLEPDEYSGNMTFVAGTVNATVALNGEVLPGSGEQYTITVESSPANGGTVAGGGTYYEGSHHDLTATPAAHYIFSGWQLNGSIVSTDNPYNITVTGDVTYTAVFEEMQQYTVTVNQAEGGTIIADPTTAYPGDVVTLTVNENSGYFFVEWNVVDANNQAVVVTNNQFTMPESNVSVTAVFTSGFEVTLVQTEYGTISADKTSAIQPGEAVTLTATPDNGCVFLAWYVYKTGDPRAVVSVINNEFFLMPSSDVTVQAIFVTEEEHQAQLGSGTNTNQYIPTYVRANYSLSQQIYTASELGNQNGRITKIAYYGYSSSGQTAAATRNLTIYIAHTDKSTFSSGTDWEVMGSVAKVFEGNVTFNRNAWATITLNTPFEYDGTSNINICVVDNTSSTSGSSQRYIQFYRYNGTNRAIYANGSSSYADVVGYSDQLSSTSGTRISYVNRINITMMVPGSAESLTVSPGEIDDFSYVEGQGPSATNKLGIVGVDLSNDITLTAPSNFEISLTESGTYSSSLTIPRETSKRNRNVQTWDFEDGLQGWTVVDADGDGYNWAHSTSFEGHDGSTGIIFSQSYDNDGGVLTPDNWLISPQVTLGGSFSMWAHPQQAAYPAEHFAILVSTTNTNAESFTMLGEWTLSSGTWKQFSVDLSAFAGQTGYIAVRHYNCTNQFYLNVDDFMLDTDAAITIEMPVTITPATVYVRMAEGLDAGEYDGTLTASAGSGDNLNGSVNLGGEVIKGNHWTPVQVGPNTMAVIAQVQINGVPVTDCENYELGAFCGSECRGDVIGLADEDVFFISLYGNDNDVNTFMLYDMTAGQIHQGVCYYTITYHDNSVVGTYENPVVLNFVTTSVFTKDIIGYTANAKDRYYLIASPIGTVSPEQVGQMLDNNYDLYYFDQNGTDQVDGEIVLKEWRNYEVNTFNLMPGKGYLYANSQDVTLTFNGTAYYGNGEVTLSKADNVRFSGWNLVGNPFAQTAYITRPFYTMNESGTEIIAGTGNSVDAMEGVFVIAESDGETMTFYTSAPAKGEGQIVLNVSQGEAVLDRTIVRIGEGDVLPKFMLNGNNTKVYITQEGHEYAVVHVVDAGVIPVSFKAAHNGEYSICVNVDNTEVNYLHLIDNMTGADIDILQTPNYRFDATKDDYTSRFKLVFATGGSEEDSFAFFTNGNWIISNDGEAMLQVIDINGRILSSEEIHGSISKHIDAVPGVYMLRLIKGDDVKVQKIVVR